MKKFLLKLYDYYRIVRYRGGRVIMGVFAELEDNLNLEYWMTNLPPQIKQEPIIYLAIPGSHDSMTFGITGSSELAPDAPQFLKHLVRFFRPAIVGWTKTQSLDAMGQLKMGIRYFDLRVATKTLSNELFFTHGLYAEEITGPLVQVREFLDTHPQEVVILDFQHFYNFATSDHENLVKMLLQLYGPRLCHGRLDLESVTLESMQRYGQQVVVVYRSHVIITNDFWRGEVMPTPWPQQDTTRGLNRYLLHLKRPPGIAFVHQAVLTPTSGFILLRLWSNIRNSCAKPVLQDVLPNIENLNPGPPMRNRQDDSTVNIVIADYIDLNQAEFPKAIVNLNYKLLENPSLMFVNRVKVAPL